MLKGLKVSHPNIYRYLFTVTTFSKLLALFFFILFPVLGFYMGAGYENAVQVSREQSPQALSPTPKLIGGDRDSHGCLLAAGYSWCGAKNKCLRVWEEPCAATPSATPTQTTCRSDSDCPALEKCMTVGPIIANQPVQKTCVKQGTAVPL